MVRLIAGPFAFWAAVSGKVSWFAAREDDGEGLELGDGEWLPWIPDKRVVFPVPGLGWLPKATVLTISCGELRWQIQKS